MPPLLCHARRACAACTDSVSMVAQVDFYRERRLRPMLKYANDSEMSRLGDVLMRNLDSLFQGIEVGKSVASRCPPWPALHVVPHSKAMAAQRCRACCTGQAVCAAW
jgi:hypothetical protein